jgi:hypothetical protein
VEAESASGIAPAADQIPVLQRAATGAQALPVTAQPLEPPYSPLVAHALQIAAVAALGEATDDRYDRLSAMGSDLETELCLERAKRDLFQCLAVSKPNYEDIFCMGRHEMLQPAGCIAAGAGVELPPAARTTHHHRVHHS